MQQMQLQQIPSNRKKMLEHNEEQQNQQQQQKQEQGQEETNQNHKRKQYKKYIEKGNQSISKKIQKIKSKKNTKQQNIIWFLIFICCIGFYSFQNLIAYLSSDTSVQVYYYQRISTLAFRIIFFTVLNFYFSDNYQQTIIFHFQSDQLLVTLVTVGYNFINLGYLYGDPIPFQVAQITLNCFLLIAQSASFQRNGILQWQIITHHVAWKSWQILIAKIILIAGIINFLALLKIITPASQFGQECIKDPACQQLAQQVVQANIIYVVCQSAYFGKIFECINKMYPKFNQHIDNIHPLFQKLSTFITKITNGGELDKEDLFEDNSEKGDTIGVVKMGDD